MDCYPSSPFLPTTSDPPSYDDWELDSYNTVVLPPSTHSDELEALQLLQEETTAFKTQRRQVIQHRSWKLEEVFLSDQDYPLGRSARFQWMKQVLIPNSNTSAIPNHKEHSPYRPIVLTPKIGQDAFFTFFAGGVSSDIFTSCRQTTSASPSTYKPA